MSGTDRERLRLPAPANETARAFYDVLTAMRALHDRKGTDYGAEEDSFANVRAAGEWGVSPWVGVFIRICDKVHRLQRFAQRGDLANESAADSMLDIAVYAPIALILYLEESGVELKDFLRALVGEQAEEPF